MAVGIRELKNNLSRYVRLVQDGEEVLVTDRGKVVALLTQPERRADAPDLPPSLLEAARKGLVVLGKPHRKGLYPRLPRIGEEGLAQRLLDEVRGDR